MANVRRDREISRLQGSQAQNWTNWVKAMVPPNTKEIILKHVDKVKLVPYAQT